MKDIIKELRKVKGAIPMLVVCFISAIIYTIINSGILMILRDAVSTYDNIYKYLVIFLIACIFNTGFSILRTYLEQMYTNKTYNSLLYKYCDKIATADYDMFTKWSCSKIIVISEQVSNITNIGKWFLYLGVSIVMIVVNLSAIYITAPTIVVPVILIYVVGGCSIKVILKMFSKIDKPMDELKRHRSQKIDETINGFVEVRTFGSATRHIKEITEISKEVSILWKKRASIRAWLSFTINNIDTVGTVVALLIIANSISSRAMTPTDGITIIMFIWRLIDPLMDFIDLSSDLSEMLTKMDDYKKIISYENSIIDGNIELTDFQQEIRLSNVSFSYETSDNVLSNVNMVFPKGKKIGICGLSGGGKSTLFKLLSRFYDPSSGAISIDNLDIKMLTLESLRKKFGVVSQESHIFSATIYENILYANPTSFEYEVIEAARKANIYDFIQQLPDKFKTEVGPRGLKLSGGQKQRIALARVFLQNPEIILLDEATSALDNESETIVQEALEKFKDRTIITIAHRLSTIKDSDIIYVLDNHRVAESGTHEELLAHGGIYAKLNKKN